MGQQNKVTISRVQNAIVDVRGTLSRMKRPYAGAQLDSRAIKHTEKKLNKLQNLLTRLEAQPAPTPVVSSSSTATPVLPVVPTIPTPTTTTGDFGNSPTMRAAALANSQKTTPTPTPSTVQSQARRLAHQSRQGAGTDHPGNGGYRNRPAPTPVVSSSSTATSVLPVVPTTPTPVVSSSSTATPVLSVVPTTPTPTTTSLDFTGDFGDSPTMRAAVLADSKQTTPTPTKPTPTEAEPFYKAWLDFLSQYGKEAINWITRFLPSGSQQLPVPAAA